jgi:hypothetical protein
MEQRFEQADHSYQLYLEDKYLASQEPLPSGKHHGTEEAYIHVSQIPVGNKSAHVYLSTWMAGGHSIAVVYLKPEQLVGLAKDLLNAAEYIRNQGDGRGL